MPDHGHFSGRAALAAAGPNSRFVGILWLQGESDGDNPTPGTTYQADLDALIDGFRSRLSGAAAVPFIVGQMVPDYLSSGTRAAIDRLHSGTPERKPNAGFAYGLPKANNDDGNHYNLAGQRFVGRAMFEAYQSVLTGVAVPPPAAPADLTAGPPSVSTVRLTWSASPGALAYVVDYRTGHSGACPASIPPQPMTSASRPGTRQWQAPLAPLWR